MHNVNKVAGDVIKKVDIAQQFVKKQGARQIAFGMDALTITKGIFDVALLIYEQVQQAKANKAQCEVLNGRVELIVSAIKKLDQLPDTEAYRESLINLHQKLQECLEFIQQFSDVKWYLRILKAGSHNAAFEGLNAVLVEAIQQLNLGLSAQQLLNREKDVEAQKHDAAFIIDNQKKIEALCQESLGVMNELKEHQEEVLSPQIASMKVKLHELVAMLKQSQLSSPTTEAKPELALNPRHHFPLHELDFKNVIGQGTFATVYKGRWEGQWVAIKKVKGRLTQADEKQFIREATLLERLKNPNIPQFFGASLNNGQAYLVMEYCALGSLQAYLQKQVLTEVDKERLIRRIAEGLNYLHRHQVTHCDLKSENILLTKQENRLLPKISDFGLARLSTGSLGQVHDVSQAIAWCAPELLKNEAVTAAADAYSFGMVMWEILTQRQPFAGLTEKAVLEKRQKGETESLSGIPAFYSKLITQCWQSDPVMRPSMSSIVTQLNTHRELQKMQGPLSPPTLPSSPEMSSAPKMLPNPTPTVPLSPLHLVFPEPFSSSVTLPSTSAFSLSTPIRPAPIVIPAVPSSSSAQVLKEIKSKTPIKQDTDAAIATETAESRGILHEHEHQYEAARQDYEEAIRQGAVKSKTNLGMLLLQGKGGPENKPRAAQLLKEAAKAGHDRAMYNLGLMFKTGDGVTADAKQAFKLFEAAAKRHHPEAMYQVAKAYEAGEGIAVDLEQAKIWYDQASARGHEKAGYQSQRLKTQLVFPSQVNETLFGSAGGSNPQPSNVPGLKFAKK